MDTLWALLKYEYKFKFYEILKFGMLQLNYNVSKVIAWVGGWLGIEVELKPLVSTWILARDMSAQRSSVYIHCIGIRQEKNRKQNGL